MGQNISCPGSNPNISNGISIRHDQQEPTKPRFSPLFYVNPIAFNKQDMTSIKDEFSEEEKENLPEGITFGVKKISSMNENNSTELSYTGTVKVKWDHFIKMKKKKFIDDYKILDEIGRGGYGSVYRVQMKNTKILRAAKKITKNKLKKDQHESLLVQMAIMKKLDHPNIIKLYEVYDQTSFYVMVLELCEGGDLFRRIVQSRVKQTEAKTIMAQVLSALTYLHELGIVHRDIKPENMLFEAKTKLVKIIDFGISTTIKPEQSLTARVGTPYYIAPQVLCKNYNQKCDIWSLGVVLYTIIFNTPPFIGSCPADVMRNVLKEKVNFNRSPNKKFSNQSINFLKTLIQKNHQKRPTAKEALGHEWLKGQQSGKLLQYHSENYNKEALKRITEFHFKNKLQAVVHTYIVSQLLTSEERAELLGLFRKIDKNGNGIIDSQEIKHILRNKQFEKVDDQMINKIIQFVDMNNSGQIDYTQFLVAAFDFEKGVNSKHFEQAFAYFDIDNSGEITFEQVAEFLQNEMDHEEIKLMFQNVDKNRDGVISKTQFVELLVGKDRSFQK